MKKSIRYKIDHPDFQERIRVPKHAYFQPSHLAHDAVKLRRTVVTRPPYLSVLCVSKRAPTTGARHRAANAKHASTPHRPAQTCITLRRPSQPPRGGPHPRTARAGPPQLRVGRSVARRGHPCGHRWVLEQGSPGFAGEGHLVGRGMGVCGWTGQGSRGLEVAGLSRYPCARLDLHV